MNIVANSIKLCLSLPEPLHDSRGIMDYKIKQAFRIAPLSARL
jgi:hypothetical protein